MVRMKTGTSPAFTDFVFALIVSTSGRSSPPQAGKDVSRTTNETAESLYTVVPPTRRSGSTIHCPRGCLSLPFERPVVLRPWTFGDALSLSDFSHCSFRDPRQALKHEGVFDKPDLVPGEQSTPPVDPLGVNEGRVPRPIIQDLVPPLLVPDHATLHSRNTGPRQHHVALLGSTHHDPTARDFE